MGQMNKESVLDLVMEFIEDKDVIVSTTGLTSRYLYQQYDNPQHFYNPGAMGLVSSIGLGISLFTEKRKVFILDGDGSLLMNFASIVTIGINHPLNLVHIVLDNTSYDFCSGELTNSSKIDLEKFARLSGYKTTKTINSIKGIKSIKKELKNGLGPFFFVLKTDPIKKRNYKRPIDLPQIKKRFQEFLQDDNKKSLTVG